MLSFLVQRAPEVSQEPCQRGRCPAVATRDPPPWVPAALSAALTFPPPPDPAQPQDSASGLSVGAGRAAAACACPLPSPGCSQLAEVEVKPGCWPPGFLGSAQPGHFCVRDLGQVVELLWAQLPPLGTPVHPASCRAEAKARASTEHAGMDLALARGGTCCHCSNQAPAARAQPGVVDRARSPVDSHRGAGTRRCGSSGRAQVQVALAPTTARGRPG